jgi:hypothetical protein
MVGKVKGLESEASLTVLKIEVVGKKISWASVIQEKAIMVQEFGYCKIVKEGSGVTDARVNLEITENNLSTVVGRIFGSVNTLNNENDIRKCWEF